MDDYRWLEVVVEVEVGVEVEDRVRVEASSGSRWVVVVGGVVWCGWMQKERARGGENAGMQECRRSRSSESVNERKANEWRENGMATRQKRKERKKGRQLTQKEGRKGDDPKLTTRLGERRHQTGAAPELGTDGGVSGKKGDDGERTR
jgi:hypothetical protein